MSSRIVILVLASLTLASALVVNRAGTPEPVQEQPSAFAGPKWAVGMEPRGWNMGIQLTKRWVELQLAYVVEIADYIREPKKWNEMQQALFDKEEKVHTDVFIQKCEQITVAIMQDGLKKAFSEKGAKQALASDFMAACDLQTGGWPEQICAMGKEHFLEDETVEDGTVLSGEAKAEKVCIDMERDMMKKVKLNQKAQESPFVHADDMKEEDEDKEQSLNEIEEREEDIHPPAWSKKDPEDYDPAALFAAEGKKK